MNTQLPKIHIQNLKAHPAIRAKVLEQFKEDNRLYDTWINTWKYHARPNQQEPQEDYSHWLNIKGRGSGKTRTGSEFIREQIKKGVKRIAIMGPTHRDTKKIQIVGPAGILTVCQPWDIDIDRQPLGRGKHNQQDNEILFENGAHIIYFSADKPDSARGYEYEILWADELAAWRYPEAWDVAQFGLRIGNRPRTIVTTTPKPRPFIRELVEKEGVHLTTGTTYENRDNLSPQFYKHIIKIYEGTQLGEQELEGKLLDEDQNALFTRELLQRTRVTPDDFDERLNKAKLQGKSIRSVIGLDPNTKHRRKDTRAGFTGLIGATKIDNDTYIRYDYTRRYTPEDMGKAVNELYQQIEAYKVLAEGNQGGDFIAQVIHQINSSIEVDTVGAVADKHTRALPVVGQMQQGRLHIVGTLPELETECATWDPYDPKSSSPDRLDAMVYAVLDLNYQETEIVSLYIRGMY